MKQTLITMMMALMFINVNAQFVKDAKTADQPATGKFPAMKFETPKHDFGNLKEGDVVTYIYKFKNTGDAPLVITKIRASCGCTVPSNWKKEPIMPGENSEFTVRFNTRNKIHKQHKTITIYCNTKNKTERVYFTANVTPDPKMEKQRAERRKKWAERRKLQQNKKNHKIARKPELSFADKDLLTTNNINIKKLEVKKMKLQQKMDRKMHDKKLSEKKAKKYKEKIEKLEAQIKKYREQNKKIRYKK